MGLFFFTRKEDCRFVIVLRKQLFYISEPKRNKQSTAKTQGINSFGLSSNDYDLPKSIYIFGRGFIAGIPEY